MLGYVTKISVVVQNETRMLNARGGDHAINRFADGDAFLA